MRWRLCDRRAPERTTGLRPGRSPPQADERRLGTNEMPAGTESSPPAAEPSVRLGPLVHRSVHHGAAVWVAAVVQFVLAMVVVQIMFTPSYSLSANVISDLGNTGCGNWPTSTSHQVCSPWHERLQHLYHRLRPPHHPRRRPRKERLPEPPELVHRPGGLALGGIGAIGVGIFPENVHLGFHVIFAAIAFVIGNLALRRARLRDVPRHSLGRLPRFHDVLGAVRPRRVPPLRHPGLPRPGPRRHGAPRRGAAAHLGRHIRGAPPARPGCTLGP